MADVLERSPAEQTRQMSTSSHYVELLRTVEQVHRHLLDIVKLELDLKRCEDINNVQALMLFQMSDKRMTVGELTLRGCYLGSNVSYNVKKMVENGYLERERSTHDLRSFYLELTEKGREIRELVVAMFRRHEGRLENAGLGDEALQGSLTTLGRLHRFFGRAMDIGEVDVR